MTMKVATLLALGLTLLPTVVLGTEPCPSPGLALFDSADNFVVCITDTTTLDFVEDTMFDYSRAKIKYLGERPDTESVKFVLNGSPVSCEDSAPYTLDDVGELLQHGTNRLAVKEYKADGCSQATRQRHVKFTAVYRCRCFKQEDVEYVTAENVDGFNCAIDGELFFIGASDGDEYETFLSQWDEPIYGTCIRESSKDGLSFRFDLTKAEVDACSELILSRCEALGLI